MTPRAPAIGTNTDSAETFRQAMSGLWVPASATNVRTGVTSVPTLTGTGNFTATVSPFTMVVDGTSNVLQAGYPVANDATATITITAANAQPRIDLICLQIQDNAYDGSGFSRGQFFVVAGAPSGSPAAPATPANAIPLWTVPVAANATSVVFSSATAVFPFTAAAGGIVYVRGATDKPAVANGAQYRHRGDVTATSGGTSPLESSVDGTTWTPVFDGSTLGRLPSYTSAGRPGSPTTGQAIYETDTGNISVWNGTSWRTVSVAQPSSFGTTISPYTGTVICQKVGNYVILNINTLISSSATWSAGVNYSLMTLPAGYAPSINRYVTGCMYINGAPYVAAMVFGSSGAVTYQIGSTVTGQSSPYIDGLCYAL